MAEHQCIDCIKDPVIVRPRNVVTPVGDPKRCHTHLRTYNRRQRKQARARQVERTYDISADDNHELLLLQGGRCWLCQRATGAAKSLAVDHDHLTNEVRGRLCGPCNQFIGRLGDDPEAARRLVGYLTGDTPYRRLRAQQMIRKSIHPDAVVVNVFIVHGGEMYAGWHRPGDRVVWSQLVRLADRTWSLKRLSTELTGPGSVRGT